MTCSDLRQGFTKIHLKSEAVLDSCEIMVDFLDPSCFCKRHLVRYNTLHRHKTQNDGVLLKTTTALCAQSTVSVLLECVRFAVCTAQVDTIRRLSVEGFEISSVGFLSRHLVHMICELVLCFYS